MLDHIGLDVSDCKMSKRFYAAALAPLRYELIMEIANWAGFGIGGKPELWIHQWRGVIALIHIAFRSSDRAQVRRFYSAAIDAGGRDNGAPGIREHYQANYYAAFVFDPDGHNLEAVCHGASEASSR